MRRLTFLGAFLSSLLTGKLFAQQPIIITPGPTTFGPPKPANGECPIPTCRTKHPVPSRTAMAAERTECAHDSVGAFISYANCRPFTADDMPRSIQQRCTFCSCMFAIDTTE